MPRTSGRSVILVPISPPAHHDGVHPRGLVIALAHPDLFEPEAPIELLGSLVVGAYLQEYRRAAAGGRLGEQRGQQRGADAPPPMAGAYADGLHVARAVRGGEPRVAEDPGRLLLGEDVIAAVRTLAQLLPEHALAPRVLGKQRPLQLEHRGQIGLGHLPHDHAGVTFFRAPGARASGRRRYSGSGGSRGGPAAPDSRVTASSASAVAVGSSAPAGGPSTSSYSAAPSPTPGRPAAAAAAGGPTASSLARARAESYRAQ